MNEIVHITFGRTVIALRREIALPNDPVLCRQLESKLEEYRNRLVKLEMTAHREASTNYKIWVLQQLLDQRRLDFLPLKAAVARDATNQTLAIAYLAYAWKVIENYCINRGAQNRGGTGLPVSQLDSSGQQAPTSIQPTTAVEPLIMDPIADDLRALSDQVERPSVAIPMADRANSPKRSKIPKVVDDLG